MRSFIRMDGVVFGGYWKMFLFWGLLLSLLGVAAITFATFTTVLSVVFLGVFILLGGLVVLFDTFSFWRKKGFGFWVHLLMGLLYTGVGLLFLKNPVDASVSLTFILGVFYVMVGIFRGIYAVVFQPFQWAWGFFSAVLAFALGLLILNSWPSSGLFFIGLFVGVDLLFIGLAYTMVGLAARKHN